MEGRAAATPNGIWEVVGVLAVVVPCGVLAGLYLATSDPMFLVVCGAIAVVAAGILLFRKPVRRPGTRRRAHAAAAGGGNARLAAVRSVLGRTFTLRVLKLLGLAAWLLAWGVLAVLYARITENANIGALAVLVVVGGCSPVILYLGLETGVRKLGRRMGRDDPDF